MRRWTTPLWIAAALSAALAGWLFLPRARAGAPTLPRVRAVLVDASASVSRAPSWLGWVRGELEREALGARAAGERLSVVSFADGVASALDAGDPSSFLRTLTGAAGRPFDPTQALAGDATQLADALTAVSAALTDPARPAGELVVLAPFTYTGASPAAALARLTDAGATIRTRAPPRAEAGDLGLLELELAPRVEAGARLVARARLVWHPGLAAASAATLALELEAGGATRSFSEALALPAGGGEFELPLDCGLAAAGRNELRARCRLAAGPDLLRENDAARALAWADGARTIGVVRRAEDAAAAEAWLAPGLAGLQFRFVAPEELGPDLEGLSALVSFDLGARELPAALVSSFVRHGGGWLALSGWRFLADWLPAGADGELARLLPCAPAQGDAPPRDVVLLVDGSGSMEGAPFESVRAAALELVGAALPSDRVSLRFFTASLEPEHVLKERSAVGTEDADAARRAARELLALRVPAGRTFLLRALRALAAELGERETLVLLLTDGRDLEALPDPLAAARAAAAELARNRARLVVIAVGEPERDLLAALAGGADEVRTGTTLGDLQAVFRRELARARCAEGELALQPAARAAGSLADEVASAAATPPALAPLERYVRNRLRPGAAALWTSSAGEPVLALARAGLGRTALFASYPGSDWARRYAGAPLAFEGLLRWLARGPAQPPVPRARLEQGELVVRGLEGAPAELPGRLSEPERGRRPVDLLLSARGTLPAEVERTRAARVDETGWESPVLELRVGEDAIALPVARALADEFAWRECAVPPAWLEARPAARGAASAERSQPAAATLVAVALGLLLAAGFATARRQGLATFGR